MQSDTDQLFALVYDELKRLARRYLRRERSSHTLQPTALINEAYIQLSSLKSTQWQNRSHFLGVAALAMRRVLTDYARDRRTIKRCGRKRNAPKNAVTQLDPCRLGSQGNR